LKNLRQHRQKKIAAARPKKFGSIAKKSSVATPKNSGSHAKKLAAASPKNR
jgi:hypothetical protein